MPASSAPLFLRGGGVYMYMFYIAICTDGRVRLLVGEDYDTEYFKEDKSGTV